MDKVRAEKRSPSAQISSAKTRKKRWGLRFSLGFGLATAVLAFATYELAKQDLDRGKQLKQLQAQIAQDAAALQAMGQVTGAPDSAQITLLQQPGGPPGRRTCSTTRAWAWASTPAKSRRRLPARATSFGLFPLRARPLVLDWSTPISKMERWLCG